MKSGKIIMAVGVLAIVAAVAFFMRQTEPLGHAPSAKSSQPAYSVAPPTAAANESAPVEAAVQAEAPAAAGLVPEASAQQIAPSMDAPWKRFAQAEVVDSREGQPDADGMVERIRVVKTDMKYPHVRIVEKMRAADPTGEPVSFTAAVADHMMVRVHDGLAEEKVATIAAQHGFSVRKKMLAPDTYLIAFGDVSIDALPQALEAFNAEANAVQYAEPDYVVFASATMPNDPAFNQLWGMHQQKDKDIDAPEAWDLTQGSSNVVVAVIDTGIDYGHEDLSSNMWRNPGEIPGNGIDDDGNGFRDDVYGWDFCNEDSDPYDDNFHGTHCAGTIGAAGNNGIGVAGVNWGVKLMAVKTMNQGGSGYISDAIDAVYYTTRRGVRLTSNSWGYYGWLQSMKDAIDDAGTSNILFVAAAGNEQNDNDNNPCYPASFVSANIISVAATDADDDLTWFSNYGKTAVDLGAPGEYIYSTVPTAQGKYASYSGTSMATPHVAGACALVAAYSPALTAAQIKQRILDNTDRSSTLSGKTVTGGRLNAYKGLSGAVPLEPPAAPSVLTATPFTNRVELAWTDNATNETAFVAERRSGSSGFTAIATLAANTTSRTDTNVMGGVTYVYRVKATNAAGNSAYSSEASATVPGAADAWDPGNDVGSGAILLSPITTVEASHGPHTLSGTDPYDWFKADLVAGNTYNFNSIGGSGDTYADLFRDAAGAQLVLADDDGGGGLMFMLEFTADTTATYYIRVRTEPAAGNAAYNMKYSLVAAANQAPAVSLTSPASNAVYQAPGTISIVASASDPDGSIAEVKFYNGTNLLSTDSASPYAYTWSGVAAGSYTLKAVALDNGGLSVTSAPVPVVVNAQPTVNITSPSNGASYLEGTPISISATASDTDGIIGQVAFYDGTTLLNTDTSSPFSYSWTNAAVGNHSLTAQAVDNQGGSGVSGTTTVSVVAAQPVLTVAPTNFNVQVLAGQDAASGTFTVANSGSGTMNYTISESIAWLSVSQTNGSSTGAANTHTITYSTAGLATGTYSGIITVAATGATGSPKTIAVNLLVSSSSLDTGLVAYYPFNGNANDESGNGIHGIVNGALLSQDRYGNTNAAYSFLGQTNYIRANIGPARFTNDFTMSIWFSARNITNYYPTLVYGGPTPYFMDWIVCGEYSSYIQAGTYRRLNFYLQSPNGLPERMGYMYSSQYMETNRWYHACIVRSNLQFSMFVDGVLSVETNSPTAYALTGSYIDFGNALNFANSAFQGSLDDIRIYNRALTSNEVWELYGGGSASVSGTISYSGSQTGQIVVVAGAYTNKIAAPGAYSISDLPTPGTYSVTAFRDVNGNNQRDASEPYGAYAGNPIILTSNLAGVDMTLSDPIPADGSNIYVAVEGSDLAGNGSANNPFATIQKGIDVATNGQSVIVGPGTYTGAGNRDIDFGGKAITVLSLSGAVSTIIDVQSLNESRGFYFHSNEGYTSILDGFTIRNGHIQYNGWGGGGVYCENGASPTIRNCVFESNWTHRNGGAVHAHTGSSPIIESCMFSGNTSEWSGGAISIGQGREQGQSVAGGQIINSLFYGNVGTGGAITFLGFTTGHVYSSTIVSNTARYVGRGGVSCNTGTTVQVVDTIVFGNTGPGTNQIYTPDSAAPTVMYSCVEDGFPGAGNITSNPLAMAANGYRLLAGSACINAGTNLGWMAGSGDLDGNPRIVGERTDIGAYEYQVTTQVTAQISGTVTYGGIQSGTIWIVATNSMTAAISDPGSYEIANLPTGVNYSVTAFRDMNGNEIRDSFEPQGNYSNNPIYLTHNVTAIDIALVDPDTDGDGLSDGYEIGYGRYRLIEDMGSSWPAAHSNTLALGGHLATITSEAEWKAMQDVLGVELLRRKLWIGGTDEETEGVWKWVTGELWSYTRWRAGEPNNANGIEDYLITYLNDDWCDAQPVAAEHGIRGYVFEIGYYTSPTDADTDDDGLNDGQEVNTHLTDPGNPDTDGDGLNDGAEVAAGTNPLDPDSDDDGLNDYYEVVTRPCLDPLDSDSDNDGVEDGAEVTAGSDPCSAGSGLFSIAGTVSYTGSRTGQVIVTASAAMPTNGLVASYPFNGNANDESGNGNNGTIMGGCSLVADRAGNPNQAYDFDGTSGYIVCGNSTAFDVNEHTISAWIRADVESPHISSILGKGYPYHYEAICFAAMSNRLGTLFASGTEANNVIYGEKALNTQTWYHVAMTYDGAQVKFYCDGQIDREIPRTGAVRVNASPLALGRRSGDLSQIGDEHYFNGILDEIRIYNRALSSNEVAKLYRESSYLAQTTVGAYLITNVVGGLEYAVTAFMDCDGNGVLDDGEPRGSYAANPVLVTNNVTGVDIELTVPGEGWTMRATHALAEYDSPGSNVVACEVYYPTNKNLLGLGWTVGLPEGWSLLSAEGDGDPLANPSTGEILFSGPALTNNPIRFTYAVGVPVGQSGPKAVTGSVDYFLSGEATWLVRMAEPDPLIVNPGSPYHSSDFRNPKWVIDLQECNRTLSYWRSRGYGVRPGTVDGYEAEGTSQDGSRHKADYREPYWKLDGQEALRVIGYWMAGGYHQEASGADGYAPGMSTNGSLGIMDVGDISAMSVAPSTYVPGHQITLRGTLSYSNDIVGLLWRPQLPDGWTIISVSANGGTPEVVDNEILFTTKLPPSPLEIVYVCNVPGEMSGDALVQTDVQLMRQGTANPQSLFGMMAPNMLQLDTDGDGLPDWVETNTRVYVSPTDTGTDPNNPDTDGDGVLDGDEIPAGTNPNQVGDSFRITSFAAKTGEFIMAVGTPYEVKWSSVAGKTYSVFRTTNLLDGFLVLQSNVLATPPVNTFIDTLPPDPKASYSVGVE